MIFKKGEWENLGKFYISKLLQVVSEHYGQKITTVFGCGGNRDNSKRSMMAKAAEQASAKVVVTNDNPRNEDPKKIVAQIVKDMHLKNFDIIFDRKEAISEGLKKLKTLEEESVLLIAGKGHENFQILNGKEIEFNDLTILNELKDVI